MSLKNEKKNGSGELHSFHTMIVAPKDILHFLKTALSMNILMLWLCERRSFGKPMTVLWKPTILTVVVNGRISARCGSRKPIGWSVMLSPLLIFWDDLQCFSMCSLASILFSLSQSSLLLLVPFSTSKPISFCYSLGDRWLIPSLLGQYILLLPCKSIILL